MDFYGIVHLVSGINHNERELIKRRQDVNVQVLENGASI